MATFEADDREIWSEEMERHVRRLRYAPEDLLDVVRHPTVTSTPTPPVAPTAKRSALDAATGSRRPSSATAHLPG